MGARQALWLPLVVTGGTIALGKYNMSLTKVGPATRGGDSVWPRSPLGGTTAAYQVRAHCQHDSATQAQRDPCRGSLRRPEVTVRMSHFHTA